MRTTLGLLVVSVAALAVCLGSALEGRGSNDDINRKLRDLPSSKSKIRTARFSIDGGKETVTVRCEENLNPCMNNAVCKEEGNCECPVGYTGVTCEKDSRCDFEQEFCLKNSGNNTINFTRTSREKLIPSSSDGDHYAFIRSSQTCTTKKSGIMFSSKYVTGTVRVEFDYLVKGNGKLSFFYDAFIDSANHVYVSSTDDVWRSFNGTITTTKSKSFYGFRGNVGGDLTDNFQYYGVVAVDNVRITSINT